MILCKTSMQQSDQVKFWASDMLVLVERFKHPRTVGSRTVRVVWGGVVLSELCVLPSQRLLLTISCTNRSMFMNQALTTLAHRLDMHISRAHVFVFYVVLLMADQMGWSTVGMFAPAKDRQPVSRRACARAFLPSILPSRTR